jgi:hypothetical protein
VVWRLYLVGKDKMLPSLPSRRFSSRITSNPLRAWRLQGKAASTGVGKSIISDRVLKAAADPACEVLAQQIIRAEAELRACFEPGKTMPSVRFVNDNDRLLGMQKLVFQCISRHK